MCLHHKVLNNNNANLTLTSNNNNNHNYYNHNDLRNPIRKLFLNILNPGVGGIFFLSLALFCFTLLLAKLSNH